MTRLKELNIARLKAGALVESLGVMNTPTEYSDRLKASARYRLAHDAWIRAEQAYGAELAHTSTDVLTALAMNPDS